MPELRSQTLFSTIEPPAAILPPGAAVTTALAKQFFDCQREAVADAVRLAARRIRAAHPAAAVHAKACGPRTLLSVIGERDDECEGYTASHDQCWPFGGKLVEGAVLVGWAGEVWIRWTGIAPPAGDETGSGAGIAKTSPQM